MCGHSGIAGTIGTTGLKVFNDLMVITSLRGQHSAGVAAVDRDVGRANKDTYLVKAPGNVFDLMDHKRYGTVVASHRNILLGHCRAATVGKINAVNAHPFEFDNCVGAHNGTIPHMEISKIPGSKDYGTDSEAIMANISKDGGPNTVIPLIQGAWALVWYDKTDHTINFLRNKERSFFFAIVDDDKTLIWASEADMIHLACGRNGVDSANNVWVTAPDTHYKFKVPTTLNEKFDAWDEFEVKGRKEEPKAAPFQGGPQTGYYQGYGWRPQGGPQQVPLAKVEGEVKDNVVPFGSAQTNNSTSSTTRAAAVTSVKKGQKFTEGLIQGYNNGFINEVAFDKLTGSSCAMCDEVHTWDELMSRKSQIVWLKPDTFVCVDCDKDETRKQWLGLVS